MAMAISSFLATNLLFSVTKALPTSIADTPPQSPAIQNEVGWQSIFWSLFTLGLLAMTQPSILDYGFSPSSLLFLARASPLVCATDTIEVLLSIVYYLFNGSSLRLAASKVVLQRHRDRCGAASKKEELGKSTIRMHPHASLVVFLGSITQAAKIFGFQGLVWEKFVAGIYLGSYVLLSAVLAFARDEEKVEEDGSHDLDPAPPDGVSLFNITKTVVAFGSVATSFLVCSWAVTKVCNSGEGHFALEDILRWSSPSTLKVFLYSGLMVGVWIRLLLLLPGLLLQFLCFILGLTSLGWVFEMNLNVRLSTRLSHLCMTIVYLCLVIATWYSYEWGASAEALNSMIGKLSDGAGLIIVCFVFVWFVLLIVAVTLGWDKTSSSDIWGVDWDSFLVMHAAMHLVVVCLYFSFVYDPSGTVKPSWTEKLG